MPKANLELKSLRVKHDMSQEATAQLLEMTVTTYNRKENGLREFTVNEAGKLAELFNVTIEAIFFNDEVTKMTTNTA
jgi:putative transcriptional regulator